MDKPDPQMINQSRIRTHNIGGTTQANISDSNGHLMETGQASSSGNNPNENNLKRHRETDDGEDERDDAYAQKDPPSPKPNDIKRARRNARFTGTVTLCVNESLKQNLTVLFGLRISPSLGDDFADCRVVVDPITVRASTLFSDDDDDDDEMQDPASGNHFYTTEGVCVMVGPSLGACDAPVSVHPLPHHFAERRTISTKNQIDVSLEASANPKFTLKGSRGSGKTVDYGPITTALDVDYIGPGPRNDFHWRYRPIGGIGANLELSSANPPIHEATFRVDSTDTPKFIKVITHATFKQNGKLGRQKTPNVSAAIRVLRDLRAMHIIARLAAKVENNSNDWFLFPAQNKKGCRLRTEVRIDGGKLKDSRPDELESPGVVAKLNSQVSSSG
jgi:hypothetical protein